MNKKQLKKKSESTKRVVDNLILNKIELTEGHVIREYPIIVIEWSDVMSVDLGLLSPDEIDFEPCRAKIVGFLVKETKEAYYLAKEMWETGQCKYIHVIPKKTAIYNVTVVEEK